MPYGQKSRLSIPYSSWHTAGPLGIFVEWLQQSIPTAETFLISIPSATSPDTGLGHHDSFQAHLSGTFTPSSESEPIPPFYIREKLHQ